ncbi:uncharacterized protein [Aegilops tauschii subsp. strangulata]|uniref:uncharacterized protein n=1 Tax=Aegilops tauschii subsp. strangulata TaxID=200361 RepID=UPI003CC8CEE7
MDRFREALEACELCDIGYEGDKYTWRNHNKDIDSYIRERLDRATANALWCEWFPEFTVINGAPRHSDHRPVIVSTQGGGRRMAGGDRGFRFEAWWLKEEGCSAEVQGAWEQGCREGSGDVASAMRCVAGRMRKWGKEVAGELESRLRKARRSLESCMRAPVSEEKIREEARCTRYFMAVASAKKKANGIKMLRRDDGTEVKEGEGLNNYVCSFSQDLFTSTGGHRMDELLSKVQPRITAAMKGILEAEVTREEVKAALDHIGDLKAPGPDGMPSIVYKKHWHFMGEKVVDEVISVLKGGPMPDGWNDTVVVLIPKVKNPSRIKDLRPISLCNVVYKLCSKVIANRLKLVLPDIISDNQSAFVPGRLTTDNAKREEAESLREILDLYESCSGQCINLEKSAIMFSPNTSATAKNEVKNAL